MIRNTLAIMPLMLFMHRVKKVIQAHLISNMFYFNIYPQNNNKYFFKYTFASNSKLRRELAIDRYWHMFDVSLILVGIYSPSCRSPTNDCVNWDHNVRVSYTMNLFYWIWHLSWINADWSTSALKITYD